MVRGDVGKLDAPTVVEAVGTDKERLGPFAHNRHECRIDFSDRTRVEDLQFQPDVAGSRLHIAA
jgi:hypothetical protein